MSATKPLSTVLIALVLTLLAAAPGWTFCGFFVAKADTQLFNNASKVVLVRDGERTVLTMASDYRGEPAEFALVVPVPTFLEREQIHVGDPAVVDHLDAYSSPRLAEYYDPDPCQPPYPRSAPSTMAMQESAAAGVADKARADALGVTIEASYTVGEYDILILSAKESDGLETWLRESGYRIPRGASEVLGSYLKQKMRFFVAKVNLKEQSKLGYSFLRPLQVAYESPKFMLPIRLGTVNADGPQELFVFALNRKGRVETTNYRTVRLPTDVEIPPYVKEGEEFGEFYRAMFAREVQKERMRAVFLEYAWDMNSCDPCAAEPLDDRELQELGVFWLPEPGDRSTFRPAPGGARDVFITRLHLRYTAESFPEDLRFQETGDRSSFQGRYVIRHPWKGSARECSAAAQYLADLRQRQAKEAETLASLTGWDINKIRDRMQLGEDDAPPPADDTPWWKKLWGGDAKGR